MYQAKANYYQMKGNDRRIGRSAYDTLLSTYIKVLKVNLLYDRYDIIKVNKFETTLYDSFSEWISEFGHSNLIHDDDCHNYLSKTNIDYLRNYFTKTSYYNIRYRRVVGNEMKDVLMEIIASDDYSSENQIVFLYVKDISQ